MWLFAFFGEFRPTVSSLQIKHSHMKIYLGCTGAWLHETWSSQLVQLKLHVLFQQLLPIERTAARISRAVASAHDLVLVFVSMINEVRKLHLQSVQKPFYSARIKSRLPLNALKSPIIKTLRLQVWPQKCYSHAVGIQSFLPALPSLAFTYLLYFTRLMSFVHSIKPPCLQASYSPANFSLQLLRPCYQPSGQRKHKCAIRPIPTGKAKGS